MDCPVPQKIRYRSLAKANKAIRQMGGEGRTRKLYAYPCETEEHFHLGTDRKRTRKQFEADQRKNAHDKHSL